MNLSQKAARMKCYFHHEQNHFLDNFKDPVPDGAVVHVGSAPFKYNERAAKYTEFVGNLTGIISVVANRDHEFY